MPILKLIGLRIAAGLLISVATGANAQANAELIVTYLWGNGTVAPQYHRAGRITIRSSGDSEIEVTKGSAGTGQNVSKTTFTPDPAKLKELLDYIRSNQLDSPPSSVDDLPKSRPRPGDGTCILRIEVRGHANNIPCSVRAVGQLLIMIRDAVPASIAQ